VCLARGFFAQEKQTPEPAPGVGDREVRCIAVDVQDHGGGVISDCGVRVGCQVIQHLICGGLRLLRRLGLFRSNVIEWH
jgi:hypothetical protein